MLNVSVLESNSENVSPEAEKSQQSVRKWYQYL